MFYGPCKTLTRIARCCLLSAWITPSIVTAQQVDGIKLEPYMKTLATTAKQWTEPELRKATVSCRKPGASTGRLCPNGWDLGIASVTAASPRLSSLDTNTIIVRVVNNGSVGAPQAELRVTGGEGVGGAIVPELGPLDTVLVPVTVPMKLMYEPAYVSAQIDPDNAGGTEKSENNVLAVNLAVEAIDFGKLPLQVDWPLEITTGKEIRIPVTLRNGHSNTTIREIRVNVFGLGCHPNTSFDLPAIPPGFSLDAELVIGAQPKCPAKIPRGGQDYIQVSMNLTHPSIIGDRGLGFYDYWNRGGEVYKRNQ